MKGIWLNSKRHEKCVIKRNSTLHVAAADQSSYEPYEPLLGTEHDNKTGLALNRKALFIMNIATLKFLVEKWKCHNRRWSRGAIQ